ncbi:MAG: bifunctional oligoribonuclease/PAP phosphatase NrnA [Candidatus Sericytochromatia bacterium]|nr:bifunctional oligoribonuclease/PAP phosphatase NrnA [Candidatus Sericytochromatia bacterium]
MKGTTRSEPLHRPHVATGWPAMVEAWLPLLKGAQRWLVCPHQAPDADTLGSSLAMAGLLRALGAEAFLVCDDPGLARFSFLPGVEHVRRDAPAGEAGAVALDAADLSRLGGTAALVADRRPLVNIDHHVSNTGWGSHQLIDPEAAATGEIVWLLYHHFGVPVDRAAATCLYAALLTDTGGFRYPSTTPRTLGIAAALLEVGIDAPGIAAAIYEQRTAASVRLLGEALRGLKLTADGRIAWVSVPLAAFEATGATEEDADAIVDRVREVAGVEALFVARESRSGAVRVSLRAKGALDVNAVAGRFGGGGHRQAAGCTLAGPLREAEERLLASLCAGLEDEAA